MATPPHRILIVEDEAASRRGLADLLSDEGYSVSVAVDGADALERIELERPDLVVSDVRMPKMDGLTLARRLRCISSVAATPLILVSAMDELNRRVEALDVGADDFVAKPIEPTELLARVRAQLRRARRHSDAVRLSLADGLTEVLNRRGIFAELDRKLDDCRQDRESLSVLLVDVDDFKQINDTFGHGAGDEVLRRVASHLRQAARPEGVVGRIGGDEFLVVLPNVGAGTAAAVAGRSTRVDAKIPPTIELSVGIATARHGDDADALVVRADAAMYAHKRVHRGRVRRRGRSEGTSTGT